jgi:hypothetical protein
MSEAVDFVGKLLAAYPNPNVSDSYIGAIAAVLRDYPREIATKCCDPLQGVVRGCKFVPTIADLVAWCEPKRIDMQRPVQRALDWDAEMEAAKVRRAQEKNERADRERRLGPELGSLVSELKELYGIRAIPGGWDAVDLCHAKARYGARFHDEVDRALTAGAPAPSGTPPTFAKMGGAMKAGHVSDDELRAIYGKRHDEPEKPIEF